MTRKKEEYVGVKGSKPRTTAEYLLNRYDILSRIKYTDDKIGIPILTPVELESVPSDTLAFGKALYSGETEKLVHFYECDRSFARIFHQPKKYMELMKRFRYVVGPDLSQKIGMPDFVRFQNFMRNGKDVKSIAKYDENGVARWEIHNDNHHGIKPHYHICNEKGHPISETGKELTPELSLLLEKVRNFKK